MNDDDDPPTYHTTPDNPDGWVDSRKSDRSVWYRLTAHIEKFLALYGLVAAIGTAFGFALVTPKRTSAELSERIDANRAALNARVDALQSQLDTARRERLEMQQLLNVIVRKDCLDRTMPKEQKQLAGLIDAQGFCIR